jgi:thiol-disulfide isomerase/thioredoxin
MAKKTRKTTRSKVLKVDSPSKIPQLEKILKEGKVSIVLVFADWCGHCHKFQKDIWEPMCKKNAIHNRVAVRDDMVPKTSLANAKFNYLPSVLVVNEKGEAETFTTPDGEATNAMPTPKNQQDMERIVNVPLTPARTNEDSTAQNTTGFPRMNLVNSPVSKEPLGNSTATIQGTPQGQVYKPSPLMLEQKGGAFYDTLRQVSQGILPIAVLGGLSYALKGGASKRRKTYKKRRMVRA